MANPFDKYDAAVNPFDKYDIPEKPKVVQDRSFLGASAETGGRALLGAGARILEALDPNSLSEQDAATLFKDDPEAFKRVTEKSAAMALSRFANEQARRSQEIMQQVKPERGAVSGESIQDLEYATLDPSKAAYLSPTRVAGDVLGSLPQTLALAVTAFFTRGRSIAAQEQATAAALAKGATQAEAQTLGRAAAIETGAQTMARVGAVGEGTLGYAGGKTQGVLEAQQVKPEVYEASPDYQALLANGYKPETARAYLAAKVGQESGLISGAVDAATNLVGGRVLGKIIGEGGSLAGRVARGFGTEGATELVQGSGEQLGQNIAMRQIDPTLDLSKGVGEAAAQGFVVGGVTGGGTAAIFGSRQRDNSLQQLKDSTDAGSAAIAANAAAGDMDMILRQTVDTQLTPAITADLAGASMPTPVIGSAQQQMAGNPLATASLPERQALIDRQAGLINEANTPGIPTFDRENLLAQAQTARGTPAPGAAAGFVDLTPMTAQEAQTRLAVMRDTTANAGGNALEMAVVPHPTQSGAFAIAKQALPNLDLNVPATGPSNAQSQYQIEASALAGSDTARLAQDKPRQEIISRAMRNVQERGGVASPAEAQIFREANLGQPYDRIDPSLAPDLSVDQKLTQATGIPLTNRPRETVQTKAAEVAPAEPVQAPKVATTKEAPFNPPDAVNILVDGFTKATKDWGDRGTLAALTAGGFLDSDGVTTPKGNALLQKINTSKRSNDEINADLKQAIGMRTVESEAPATPYSPIDIGLIGERPFRANLGLSNQPTPAAPAPTSTPEEERVDRLRSTLSTVTGGIVTTDAKLSTTREQVPGSTVTITDKGVEHTYTVAESGSLPGMTKLIQQLARRFGKKVVFFNSETLKADGFVSNQDNKTLFINAKSQMSPLAVFGHELLHLLKRDNLVAYRAIAAVVAKRMDSETRSKFREDYGSGANIEELSADLMGNAFQDESFLSDVFTEIAQAAPEGEARGIIMRLAAAINQSIKAAMDVISKMAPGTYQFKADELVKNLEEVRAALKAALVTYAKDQKIPAMQMESERAQVESRTALTASAAPEITKSSSRMVPSQWKATDQDRRQADAYERENGIRPYLSEGQLKPKVAEATLSVKREYASKDLAKGRENHPLLGLPLNKNGTVTLYFPTTNEEARRVAQDKRLRGTTPASNRIYLTNESSAPAVAAKPGNIDQPMGGANVLIQVDPALLQFDAEYPGGRKDFFIQLAEGQAFAKKMKQTKLFTLDAPRTKALSSTVTISDIGRDFNASIEAYKALSPVLQRERLKQARAVLKDEHNIGTLLGENGKLQKTRLGDYGLTFEDKSVASMGLGLASAQKINDSANTCPKSARCESLCLGETSGQNLLYGGDGQFRSGPRLSQYLKTEALVLHPADFAVVLYNEVKAFEAWANKETGVEVFKEKGKEDVVTPKQVYQPAIRFNVTSDFPPNVFKSLINAFPNTEFYDYTKNNSRSIAPNHHLTYSSDGVAQVVEGKTIGIGSNWKKMLAKLDGGFNVAMAFTSRNDIPAFLKDEVSGKTYQVWNGDNYDARFLDPKREDGVGMIVGLTNKDRTGKPEDAALKNDGFFVDYNPERDGDTLLIKDQDKLAGKKPEPKAFPIKVSAEIIKSSQRFYSALAKGIDGIQTKAAPADGWKDAIKGLVNKGAAKADEVEWSGINDWLDLQQGRVSKEQVTNYLRENGVQVTETQFGDRDETTAAMVDRYEYLENESLDRDLTPAEEREFEGLQIVASEGGFDQVETKYSKYTLAGATNYRELLLTLPERKLDTSYIKGEIVKDGADEEFPFAIMVNGVEVNRSINRRNAEEVLAAEIDEETRFVNRKFSDNFQSSHWKEKNVIAHIRVNDRSDIDGNKVLFVEELQSDWGQKGREYGFKEDVNSILRARGYKVSKEGNLFVVRDQDGDAMGDAETREQALIRAGVTTALSWDDPIYVEARRRSMEAQNAFNRANADPDLQTSLLPEMQGAIAAVRELENKRNAFGKLIAPAPFVNKTEGWLNLTLKRVLAMAVEGGYDKVAFVNGEQSADRYRLSQQISRILLLENGEFQAFDKNDELVKSQKITDPEELTPLIGKDVVQKLINQEIENITVKELNFREIARGNPNTFAGRQLTGIDLDIGGQGMKTFYNQIVPNAAKALIKKLGSKLELVEFSDRDGESRYVMDANFSLPVTAEQEVIVRDRVTLEGVVPPFNSMLDAQEWLSKNDKAVAAMTQPGFAVTDTMREKLAEGQPLFSRQRIVGESKREYTPEQRQMFENTGRTVTEPTLKERVKELRKDFALKMTQGMVDPYASVKQLDFKSYILARMSKGTAGALEAMLRYGKVSLNRGVYDADMSGGFLDRVGIPLQGELEDFLWWIAANRAERLSAEDRENLFTPADIKAGKSLSSGTTDYDYTMQHGADVGKVTRDRKKIYRDSLTTFDEFNKNALDMAEQQGLIDPESRKLWEDEFYVPFYRLAEEDGSFKGGSIKDSLVRQKAFERLKGGTEKLNSDLLANTMQNWAHLLEASAKNAAAESVLKAAEKVGAANPANANTPDAVWYMGPVTRKIPKGQTYEEAGVEKVSDGTAEMAATGKIYYTVLDPYILASLSAISYTGMKGPVMDAMTSFKHALTVGVTASPYYKIKNLMRDSVQAVATAPLSYNIAKNLKEGFEASDRKSQTYVSALASGGLIRFGNMLDGNDASRTRMLIDRGVDKSTILDSDEKIKAVFNKFKQAFDAYNEVGSRGEELNRAALYKQLISKGVGHDEASFMARDLMDFSLQGTFQTVRFLTQVVPFMNARLQGLYKLGKSANEDPKRFGAVLGATAMFSIGLLLAFKDDDDWKKREDWDRNTNWWFKIGGKAYRIPKPFEIGAIGTLAERGLEFFISKEMTGKRLGKNVSDIILDNLSMNPIPQFAKPLLDIYSNKDSFSNRPIESMGMEKLKSDYRFNSQTSMVARGLSTAGNSVSGAVNKEFLSPVQIDHVIRGYFGWLGTFVVGATDMILRPATGQVTKPASDMWKVASGNMISSLPSDQSRYVTQMYEQARELEQAYATWRQLQKDRKPEEARAFLEANREKLTRYKQVEGVKKNEAKFNEMIRMVERSSSLDADEKAARISNIKGRMDLMARRISLGV